MNTNKLKYYKDVVLHTFFIVLKHSFYFIYAIIGIVLSVLYELVTIDIISDIKFMIEDKKKEHNIE